MIVLDNTILNVAIPTIVRDLDATNSQLQWMVDAYTLVFAGLLLTAGSLGDRFGRRGALQLGLVVFGLGSLASAFADVAEQLIATRAFMGIGGAFIMPATLSIITNVFPADERGKAIGVWAGDRRARRRARPAHRRLPARALLLGLDLPREPPDRRRRAARRASSSSPTSKDPSAPRLDPIGAVLSIVGLVVAALRRSSRRRSDGWTDPTIARRASSSASCCSARSSCGRARTDHPMLDVHVLQEPALHAPRARASR